MAGLMDNIIDQQEAAYRRWANAATWRGLLSSESHNGFAESWLALLCAQIDLTVGPLAGASAVVRQGFVALGDDKANRYQRVAMQGPEMDVSVLLGKAAERAMQLRHGTVQPGEGTGTCQLAYPILVGDTLHGVVAIDMIHAAREHLDIVMRLAQWGAVWFSRLLQTPPSASDADGGDLAFQIDLFEQGLGQGSAVAAAEAIATNLAERLGLEKLSLGLRRGQAVSIFAVSHGGFTPVINDYLAALQAALAEAADDGASVSYPALDGAMASPHAAHARLCRVHGCDWVRSVPITLGGAEGGHDLLILVAEGAGAVVPGLEETRPRSARRSRWSWRCGSKPRNRWSGAANGWPATAGPG